MKEPYILLVVLLVNAVLDEFDPHLRRALYEKESGKRPPTEEGQEELALPRAAQRTPKPRPAPFTDFALTP